MSSLTQVAVKQPELDVFTLNPTTQKVDNSQKQEASEENLWQIIKKLATPILNRNFQEECKNGITKQVIANLYEKRTEIKQLDLAEIDLTKEHLEFIAGLFPYLTDINVKNARLDELSIFHEMEVASYFENPQLVTVKGLTYIPRTKLMLNNLWL